MCIEPIELWLDPQALRRGLVLPIDPDTEPFGLLVQDSGMVPVSTQIAIVNPETNCLCHVGEYGEIWVQSEACGHSFYLSKDPLDAERFNGQTVDGDPNVTYVRTGDLGFLHSVSRPIGPGGANVEMQILFVLGNIGETFDVNGLSHFPMDIESSIERCHRNVVPGGSAVFQAGGLVVVLAEVHRKNFLASIVPVIVNAVLNTHQLVVDIVAFVGRGDFPRSRLGEKQRGKILAGWVTRRLRTIAQFGIKDFDAPPDVQRHSSQSFHNGSVHNASSLRHVESHTTLDRLPTDTPPYDHQSQHAFAPLPEGVAEMPANSMDDDGSILESPPVGSGHDLRHDEHTTTGLDSYRPRLELNLGPETGYSPIELPTHGFAELSASPHEKQGLSELAAATSPVDAAPSPSVYSPLDGAGAGGGRANLSYLDLPSGANDRWNSVGARDDDDENNQSGYNTGTYARYGNGGGGGLRIANRTSMYEGDLDWSPPPPPPPALPPARAPGHSRGPSWNAR